MFTGLVEEVGSVRMAGPIGDGFELTITARKILAGISLGDSIAINGVCLTVTRFDAATFTVGLAPETLNRTNLGKLKSNSNVNLERAALPTTRLGGHYVQGHVDGIGHIESIKPDQDALWVKFSINPTMMRYIVPKGYITIDGASLTVVHTGLDWFDITLIAYSQTKLALSKKSIGDSINIEVDILAKYVERLIVPHQSGENATGISAETLANAGFNSSLSHQGAS